MTINWAKIVTLDQIPEKHHGLVNAIGIEAALKMAEWGGGDHYYIPQVDILLMAAKRQYVIDHFTGSKESFDELRRATGYSKKQIYNIIEAARKDSKKPAENQLAIFDRK